MDTQKLENLLNEMLVWGDISYRSYINNALQFAEAIKSSKMKIGETYTLFNRYNATPEEIAELKRFKTKLHKALGDNGTCYHVLIEGKKNIAVTIRRAR